MSFLGTSEPSKCPHKLAKVDLLHRHLGILPEHTHTQCHHSLHALVIYCSLVSEEGLNDACSEGINSQLRDQHQVLPAAEGEGEGEGEGVPGEVAHGLVWLLQVLTRGSPCSSCPGEQNVSTAGGSGAP